MPTYKFGSWLVSTKSLILEHNPSGYGISLEQLIDPARILDFLAQVNTKTWATSEAIGDLFKAIDYCIQLQASVCGMGTGRNTTINAIKENLEHPPRDDQFPR